MNSLLKRAHFKRARENQLLFEWIRGYCSVNSNVKIEIPKRIERSPTDILEAISGTYQRDPTAGHYKFVDDPHFDIQTQSAKRSYALAKEAGRKAAWWVVENHKDLFYHKEADPPIEAFYPSTVYTKDSSDLSHLIDLIKKTQVSESINVYKFLKEKQVEISESIKLDLLELCCFYNNEDHGDERLEEEKWFFRNDDDVTVLKTWKSNGFAEELFLELGGNPRATCAMIQGRIKYFDVNTGHDLYIEASREGIPLNTGVYNSLIGVASSLKQSETDRWKLILDFLREMNEKKVPVNIGTLNAALKSMSRTSRLVKDDTVLSLLSEFKRLKIEPSLGSYYYVLKHFHNKQKRLPPGLLNSVLSEIDGKEHTIRHESDVHLFPFAMNLCCYTKNLTGAKQLMETLNIGKNVVFLSNDAHEVRFFRDYLRLVFAEEPIEIAMETFQALVPLVHAPDFQTFETVLGAISKNGAIEYFPLVWKLFVTESKNSRLYELLLSSLVLNPGSGDDFNEFYTEVANKVYNVIETRSLQERSTLNWTPQLISGVFALYVRVKSIKDAKVLFAIAEKRQFLDINPGVLDEFLELCVNVKTPELAMKCLRYAHERQAPNCAEMAKRIRSEFLLNDIDKNFVAVVLDSQ